MKVGSKLIDWKRRDETRVGADHWRAMIEESVRMSELKLN